MTAQELCDLAEFNEEIRESTQSVLAPRTFVEQLGRSLQLREAIRALAQVLPPGAAIAWGLASIRGVEGAVKMRGAAAAIESIEHWLAAPDEDRRRATRTAADKAGIATPAGCLGLAVFYSGGSMAPPQAPVSIEPARHVCGKLVAGAMAMAAVVEPARAQEKLRAFFDHGMRAANQMKIWEKED
jgi:hypothetical protein